MTREWNSSAYHSLSDPQYRWGLNVLGRLQALPLHGNENILDAGCGTGRVTAELMRALPQVRVTAVDASENMISQARKTLAEFGDRVTVKQCDLLELSSVNKFDVVFSTAVFHWIKDHDRLFANLFRTLSPGGILLAQCGGGPNLQRLRVRTSKVLQSPQFSPFFQGWERVWEYPDAGLTATRLEQAGFSDVETRLEAAPTPMPDEDTFRRFCSTVILHPYLERVPEELQNRFLDPIVAEFAQDRPAFMLDYWRLNILARRARAA